MTGLTFTMPMQIETDRLILRMPVLADQAAWLAFMASERARFVGGNHDDRVRGQRAFGHMAGLWMLRGYGSSILQDKESGQPIGHGGIWHPLEWPEPEFGWWILDGAFEGRGLMREAIQAVGRFAFTALARDSFVSYIDRDNHASAHLAKRLGAVIDPDAATPGFDDIPHDVWRHHKESFRYD